jgi:hypothetical protein
LAGGIAHDLNNILVPILMSVALTASDDGTHVGTELFKGRHFDQEIIVLCVRWYLTFKLSSRDLVQIMAERGITVTHTTILRWVQRYVPEFEKRWSW